MHRNHRIGGNTLETNPIGALRSGSYEGKIAGLYDLEETLGRGHFAVVKLARHVFTGEKVAVKVIDKSKLDEVSKAHLFQEVRCMKLVQHPNVVRLYEVIDTATKLYLILELGDGGDLYDYIMRHDTGLSEQVAKEYFRQIVRAISYCHQLHVVHRDLKPENVVFFEKLGVVKLTDFGFSNKFCPGQKLETSCGSLAYSAPEILLGDSYDAPAVDVWSLGVILYMLVCGQAPFQEANDSETLTMIMDCKYNVPAHVSKTCRDLIARMLVRNPEKRATLAEIANHPWLAVGRQDNPMDVLPLVSREQLSEDDHNLIVQKIVNGNIATKEEIQECLDKNEYNHITATYYLLAERKLRSKRQDLVTKNRRPENLTVPHAVTPKRENNGATGPCLLTVPRTPGDIPPRSRKCSIVQEDEEEEDLSNCSGREELAPPLNRRGSRSEGRLNLAVQERLAESEQRHKNDKPSPPVVAKTNEKWRTNSKTPKSAPPPTLNLITPTTTTIITDSSTITIPIVTANQAPVVPKYKTMPSPTRVPNTNASPLHLNEIFEEGGAESIPCVQSRLVHRHPAAVYEQRRSKFHKARTASCSSSDASDDDSEKRKKRAHKLNGGGATPTRPLQARRDSHDDSSDSQEPGSGSGGGTTTARLGNGDAVQNATSVKNESGTTNGGGTGSSGGGGRKSNPGLPNGSMLGRRHKASRRRNGETRLRESQSLNRITEVQEDGAVQTTPTTTVAQVLPSTCTIVQPTRYRSLGAKILHGLNVGLKKGSSSEAHVSRKDTMLKEWEAEKLEKKKVRLFGKYFQVHKKLCIPSFAGGLFGRNRLYKAQSCGSLVRDKVVNCGDGQMVVRCRKRAVSVVRNGDGDINQNEKPEAKQQTVQLNGVCNELTGICAIHLGQASKCCSFC